MNYSYYNYPVKDKENIPGFLKFNAIYYRLNKYY